MEKVLMCNIQMFTAKQVLSVYEDGKLIENAETTLEDLAASADALIQKYGIKKFCICGNAPEFNKKIKDDYEIKSSFANNEVQVVLM